METLGVAKRQIRWSKLAACATIAPLVLVCVGTDLLNNYAYAMSSSGAQAAWVAAALAIAVVAVPMVAAFIGWDMFLRAAAMFATAVTVMITLFAYAEKQGAHLQGKQTASAAYVNAQKDADAARDEARQAREEASRIDEASSVEDLAKLEASARGTLGEAEASAKSKGIECIRLKRCREAKAALDKLTERLGKARAKQDALKRLDEANSRLAAMKTEAADGPKSANALALLIANAVGSDAYAVERGLSLILTLLLIGGTISIALLGEHTAKLLKEGLGLSDRPEAPAPKGIKAAARPSASKPVPTSKAKATASAAPKKSDLDLFIEKYVLLAPQPVTPSDQVMEHMVTFWRAAYPGKPAPSATALGIAMRKTGITKDKIGGRQCYSCTLKRFELGVAKTGTEG